MYENEENEEIIVQDSSANSENSSNESDNSLDDSDESFYTEENDSEIDEICERICIDETEFLNSDKKDKSYYIGFSILIGNNNLLDTAITAQSFFKYPYDIVLYYLDGCSIFPINYYRISTIQTNIQIMQLHLQPTTGMYIVVLKTFWLKIIQRTWKKIYHQRESFLRKRYSIANLRHLELWGKHFSYLQNTPGLHGMMSGYSTSSKCSCKKCNAFSYKSNIIL